MQGEIMKRGRKRQSATRRCRRTPAEGGMVQRAYQRFGLASAERKRVEWMGRDGWSGVVMDCNLMGQTGG